MAVVLSKAYLLDMNSCPRTEWRIHQKEIQKDLLCQDQSLVLQWQAHMQRVPPSGYSCYHACQASPSKLSLPWLPHTLDTHTDPHTCCTPEPNQALPPFAPAHNTAASQPPAL